MLLFRNDSKNTHSVKKKKRLLWLTIKGFVSWWEMKYSH